MAAEAEGKAKIQLWGGATSRTLRAHWMLHELEVPYEPRLIGSRTGETETAEFLALNPKGKIPVLVDGDFVLTESVAIVTYLGERYDQRAAEQRLVPEPRTRKRARLDEWLSFVQMELDAHTLYVMRRHGDLAHLYGEAPAAIEAARSGFLRQLSATTGFLEGGGYLLGSHFSAADLVLATCLDWARAYGIELPAYLDPYLDKIHGRAAMQKAARLNFSISAGA